MNRFLSPRNTSFPTGFCSATAPALSFFRLISTNARSGARGNRHRITTRPSRAIVFTLRTLPGLTLASASGPRIVHARIAGVGSALPARSRARTPKVWSPSERPPCDHVAAQGKKAPPSRLHSNLEPGSVAENSNVAAMVETVPMGPLVSIVSGDTVSTSQVWVAALGSRDPAVEIAVTLNTCVPSGRSV